MKKETEKSRPTAPKTKKPDSKPKIVLGAGRHLAYISDTLFDDDLKR